MYGDIIRVLKTPSFNFNQFQIVLLLLHLLFQVVVDSVDGCSG